MVHVIYVKELAMLLLKKNILETSELHNQVLIYACVLKFSLKTTTGSRKP